MGAREILPAGVPLTTSMVDSMGGEIVSTETEALLSKLVVLPPWQKGQTNPPTRVLPACEGLLYMIEGSLRCAYEGEEDLIVLNTGDAMKLSNDSRDLLVASAGLSGSSPGAKFKVYSMKSESERRRGQ
jgi:hypothetical protein